MATNFPFNLLATVQTVIARQEYQLKKWLGRTTDDSGYDVDNYDSLIDMLGSVQPMSQSQVISSGLDLQNKYIKIYDVNLIKLLNRENNSDIIIWDGYEWRIHPKSDWNLQGRWNSVIAVRSKKL